MIVAAELSVAGKVVLAAIWILLVLVVFVLPAVSGYRLGIKRGHEVMGLVLGLLLSWVGVLIVALLPKPRPV